MKYMSFVISICNLKSEIYQNLKPSECHHESTMQHSAPDFKWKAMAGHRYNIIIAQNLPSNDVGGMYVRHKVNYIYRPRCPPWDISVLT